MVPRFTPFALALAGLSATYAYADNTHTSELDTVEVHAKRLNMETGYKAERSNITGVNTSILDTPYSIDVVTQQQLEDKQPFTLEEAVTGISGLHQGNNLAGTLDAIVKRGYGGNRDHSIMRNGFEMTQARNYTATAERVEVLKGPASMLYGMQDPGGVINIISKKPNHQAQENSISAAYGSYANRQIGFDNTGPIGSNGLAYRFIADYTAKNSWRNFGKYEQSIIAPSLSWQNDNTKVLAAYEYQNYRVPFDRGTYLDLNDNNKGYASYGKPMDIPAKRRLDEDFNVSNGHSHLFQLTGEHKLNSDWTLKAGYSYNINHYSDWQARIISYDAATRTVTRRVDGTRPSDFYAHNLHAEALGVVEQGENITHKLRFGAQSMLSELWLGDMYRSRNIRGFSVDHPQYVGSGLIESSGSAVESAQSDQMERLKTFALIAQDNMYIGDKWVLSGDLRGQYYRSISGKGRNSSLFRNYSEGFKVLPQLGAVYLLTPRWSLYGNYATSLTPNVSRGTDFQGKEIAPEEGRQFEIGTKYNGEHLSTSLALFHIKKKNVAGSITNENGESETRIIGKNRSQGLEIDVNGKLTDKLGVSANYAYTDTKILQDDTRPATIGQRFDSVPKHEAGLTLTYDFGHAAGGSWRGGACAHYIGSWGVGNTKGGWFTLPSATIYNAFVSYDAKLGKHPLNLRITGKNLGNKLYYLSSTGSNSTMPFLSIGEPRTVLFSAKLGF